MQSKDNYLISIPKDGLGNRLFMVASVYGMSRKFNKKFAITRVGNSVHSNINYDENIFKKIKKVDNIPSPYITINEIHSNLLIYTDYSNEISNNKNIAMDGYFQNSQYFDYCYNEIQDLFCFDDFIIPDKYSDQNVYFIHIRRGDYLMHIHTHFICNDDYFIKAVAKIKKLDSDAIFYVFSDDIEYCKKQEYLKNEVFIENVDECTSLKIMKNCKKGGICSNSSFSWWGSYLNKNKDKIIIQPKKWVKYNFECDVYVNNSIILDHESNTLQKYYNPNKDLTKKRKAYLLSTNLNSERTIFSRKILEQVGFDVILFQSIYNDDKLLSHILSYIEILKTIKDSGSDDWTYVFEDDINILENIKIDEIIEYEKISNEYFYLGICIYNYNNSKYINNDIRGHKVYELSGYIRGAHAIAYSKIGVINILNYIKSFDKIECVDMILELYSFKNPVNVVRFDLESYIKDHRGIFFQDQKRFKSTIWTN